jgi:hypothetical protein
MDKGSMLSRSGSNKFQQEDVHYSTEICELGLPAREGTLSRNQCQQFCSTRRQIHHRGEW